MSNNPLRKSDPVLNIDGERLWDSLMQMAKIALIVGTLVAAGSAGAAHLENGGTELHHAAWKNDYLTATKLIAQGADIHAKDNKYGYTPLHDAAWGNADKTAALLIQHGADIHAKDNKYGGTPLHYAARGNADKTAALLIQHGADIHAKTKDGDTPLHNAAEWGNLDKIAALLIENGADVNAKNNDGETPLNKAGKGNHTKMAAFLAKKGAGRSANLKTVGDAWGLLYRSQYKTDWQQAKQFLDDSMRKLVASAKAEIAQRAESRKSEIRRKHEQKTAKLKRESQRQKKSSAWVNTLSSIALGSLSGDNTESYLSAAQDGLERYETAIESINDKYSEDLDKVDRDKDKATAGIQEWESAAGARVNVDVKSHGVRFIVAPNSTGWKYGDEPPFSFAHYVARLTNGTGSCTAFLVRPKIALTNSHCVCDDKECSAGKRTKPHKMTLTFARDLTGNSDIRVGVSSYHYTDRSAGYHRDYAILLLDKAPMKGHLEVANTSVGTKLIATAGYPGDLYNGRIMTALWGCPVEASSSIVRFYSSNCHSYGGASGSPYIAVDGPNKGKVVGIHAFGHEETTSDGGGPSVANFYQRLQKIIQEVEG